MYHPLQIGIERSVQQSVAYIEKQPEVAMRSSVYCFWVLRSVARLNKPFSYLVLPDGCVDIVFDLSSKPETTGAMIMTPNIVCQRLTIGDEFYYAGIRLQPGAWTSSVVGIIGEASYRSGMHGFDFGDVRMRLAAAGSLRDLFVVFDDIANDLLRHNISSPSPFFAALLSQPLLSVDAMIAASGYSRRQLQRLFKQRVGYTPHDFIKIMRFQYALRNAILVGELYADQSHFIRESKRITGMTPVELRTVYQLVAN